jgi:hypothetical protein
MEAYMDEINIYIKDINQLRPVDVAAICSRLSWPDSGSASSIQKELDKRYLNPQPGPHPNMAIAFVWLKGVLVGWVGTRPWREHVKDTFVAVQTVECFVDPAFRRRGFARLGLQALISTGYLDKEKLVAGYADDVLPLATSCGCRNVILGDSAK